MVAKSLEPLFEKYRPRTLDEVAGQDAAVSKLRGILQRRGTFAGMAFWIAGPSGSGKTTLARIIADNVADPFFVREYAAADQLTASELDECERTAMLSTWGKGGRAFIVNEAHGLRAGIQRRLDGLLEPVPARSVWIFTTTWDGQDTMFDGIDGGPLLSRFTSLRLTNQGLAKSFAVVLKRGAEAEGLDGQPVEAYVKLLQRADVKNNCRAAWNLIESGVMLTGGAA